MCVSSTTIATTTNQCVLRSMPIKALFESLMGCLISWKIIFLEVEFLEFEKKKTFFLLFSSWENVFLEI